MYLSLLFLVHKHDICKHLRPFRRATSRRGMIKKTFLLPILLVLMTTFCCTEADAQYLAPRLSVHLSNPLGLVTKGGVKLQYRANNGHSFLAGYRKYWGFFPGFQGAVEYHRYFRTWRRSEGFLYGRVGMGESGYTPKPYFSGWETPYNSPMSYGFAGAGGGRRYNFGHFFIEANVGLKYAWLLDDIKGYNENLFYSLGPASLIDCSFHFGFQFFNEERQMFSKTLKSRRPTRYRSKNKVHYY